MSDFNTSTSSSDALSAQPSASGPVLSKIGLPQAIYDGGFSSAKEAGVLLRIGNGGAGQIGLIKALADAFIKHWATKPGNKPFQVAWYLGDTTDSINYLADGIIDIAVTYNKAAEEAALSSKIATERVYAFRDHFLLVGPPANPADLLPDDSVPTIFNKIAASGKRDLMKASKSGVKTRFLTRFDKSATNIKESELFSGAGQVPWAIPYSEWYYQYPKFPSDALAEAARLSQYTLTDRSTWLKSPDTVTPKLKIFKSGEDDDPNDPLLNPAHALYGAQACHAVIGEAFMKWLVSCDGGQIVIRNFSINGKAFVTEAPKPSIVLFGEDSSQGPSL